MLHKHIASIAWANLVSLALRRRLSRRTVLSAQCLLAAILCASLAITSARQALAAEFDPVELYDMAHNGYGVDALDLVTSVAWERGHWQAAPGYSVVFDSSLGRLTRGVVQIVDTAPAECSVPRLRRIITECANDPAKQPYDHKVRFGEALFATPRADGSSAPRGAADDMLSTYIEEVGHSWQEYLFETDGTGQQVRQTRYEDGLYWKTGWEYQVKRYILSLDGSLLDLSDEERQTLWQDVCRPDGYANPLGHAVPASGPPPEWPHPAEWPQTTPSPQELAAFCTATR